jgi:hypothetical protein
MHRKYSVKCQEPVFNARIRYRRRWAAQPHRPTSSSFPSPDSPTILFNLPSSNNNHTTTQSRRRSCGSPGPRRTFQRHPYSLHHAGSPKTDPDHVLATKPIPDRRRTTVIRLTCNYSPRGIPLTTTTFFLTRISISPIYHLPSFHRPRSLPKTCSTSFFSPMNGRSR